MARAYTLIAHVHINLALENYTEIFSKMLSATNHFKLEALK